MSSLANLLARSARACHGFACRLLDLLGQDVCFQAVRADREGSMLKFIA